MRGLRDVPALHQSSEGCRSANASTPRAAGGAITANGPTGLFPADAAGNSTIEDAVSLPEPCIPPIVFVTSPGDAWFAASGF